MRAFRAESGRILPLPRANVDTDQIIPKQFLKRIERTGFGPFLFFDWRQDPAFELNRPEHAGATILVAGDNFGCGSSREHAPWAIEDAGFRAVIAPSFADIFQSNSLKIGLLPVVLPADQVQHLLALGEEEPETVITVDLEAGEVRGPGFAYPFSVDEFTRHCLLEGLDEIGLTLREDPLIAAYESGRPTHLPRVG